MDPTTNVTSGAQGNPLSAKSQALETGAAVGQVSQAPVVEDPSARC